MTASRNYRSATRLSDSEFDECMRVALAYLKGMPSIRNRDIRAKTSIGYDQAIEFFNRAIAQGRLVRVGAGGGTRYVLPPDHKSS